MCVDASSAFEVITKHQFFRWVTFHLLAPICFAIFIVCLFLCENPGFFSVLFFYLTGAMDDYDAYKYLLFLSYACLSCLLMWSLHYLLWFA